MEAKGDVGEKQGKETKQAKKQSRQIKKTARFKTYTHQKGLKPRLLSYSNIK